MVHFICCFGFYDFGGMTVKKPGLPGLSRDGGSEEG